MAVLHRILVCTLISLVFPSASFSQEKNASPIRGGDGFQMVVQKGHTYPVAGVAVSPNGKLVASCSTEIKLWTADGSLIRTIPDGSSINGVVFSPSGEYVLSGHLDGTVKKRTLDGTLVDTFEGKEGIRRLDVSPDGKYITSLGKNGSVFLRDFSGKGVSTFIHTDFQKQVKDLSPADGVSLRFKDLLFRGGVAFSPDGKMLASAAQDDEVKLWNLDGGLIRTLKGHTDWINEVVFSPDGRYIASTSNDGSLKLWDPATGRLLLSFGMHLGATLSVVFSSDGRYMICSDSGDLITIWNTATMEYATLFTSGEDWIIYTPDGYFDASRRGGENVRMCRELEAGAIDRFAVTNDRPDIILERLGYGDGEPIDHYRALSRNRLMKAGLDPDGPERKFDLPEAEITGLRITEDGRQAVLRFRLTDPRSGIVRYNIFADDDVRDLADAFEKMEGHSFARVHATVYTDREVTLECIVSAKQKLLQAGPDDTLVLFVAGHGTYSEGSDGRYCFLPYEADPRDLSSTCVEFALMEDILQGIRPIKKLMLLDTCESGEIEDEVLRRYFAVSEGKNLTPRAPRGLTVEGTGRKTGPVRGYLYERDRYIYNDLFRRSGAIVFSSSGGGELSYESASIGNGFFTEALIRSLTGTEADADADGFVTTDEMRSFVSRRVSEETGGLQNPTVDRDNILIRCAFPVSP